MSERYRSGTLQLSQRSISLIFFTGCVKFRANESRPNETRGGIVFVLSCFVVWLTRKSHQLLLVPGGLDNQDSKLPSQRHSGQARKIRMLIILFLILLR